MRMLPGVIYKPFRKKEKNTMTENDISRHDPDDEYRVMSAEFTRC